MPLPSALRHKTRRSGHATAAPTASGMAIPIEPPVFVSQSCGGAPLVAAINPRPEVMDSSTTIAFSGSSAPIAAASPVSVISPLGIGGRSAFSVTIASPLYRQSRCQSVERANVIFARTRQSVNLTVWRSEYAALSRICEIRDRSTGAHENQLAKFFELLDCRFENILNAFDSRQPRTAL